MYALIDECIYATHPQLPRSVLDHYTAAKKDARIIKGEDMGKDQVTKVSIGEYARNAAIMDSQARLLHRLVNYLKPMEILELGTNLGKSLACMALGAPQAQCTGVEGNGELAGYAEHTLKALGIENATVANAAFEDFLSDDLRTYDFVFVDGDHRYGPTMKYFQTLKTKMKAEGAIVFHDIHWSTGMKQAWCEIKKDPDVTVTLDLYFLGIAWVGMPQAKEDFSVRFPSTLVGLLF
ncbi:MAG: class I SAM-dependent methyltransferase [Cryomorphaceae bacterium]